MAGVCCQWRGQQLPQQLWESPNEQEMEMEPATEQPLDNSLSQVGRRGERLYAVLQQASCKWRRAGDRFIRRGHSHFQHPTETVIVS